MTSKAPLQSNDPEAQLREEAINRYIAGERPGAISQALGRSRGWFYKTLSRYRRGGRAGLVSQARVPHRIANRLDEWTETAIIRIRQSITGGQEPALRYSNIGAETISSELQRAGLKPPSLSTINRVLRRHGLQQPRSKRQASQKLPEDYPWPQVHQANQLHLLDFVSRATRTIRRLYSSHLLDQARQWPFLRLLAHKDRESVSQFLVSAWQEIGLPGALYIDNDTVWRGSSYGKRSLSFIVRLCLLVGVQVIFTPTYTPEANPLIEGFNGLWDRNFWRRTDFTSWSQTETELAHFEHWCRYRRPLREYGRQSASQLMPEFVPCYLPADFDDHRQPNLPLTEGFVHFIRFVDQDGTFSLLNEVWSLEASHWAGKTIRATLDIAQQQLLVYHQPNPQALACLVAHWAYELSEKPVPLAACYRRTFEPLWLVSESFDC